MDGIGRPERKEAHMGIKSVVRSASIILVVYGAHQLGKLVGIGKGLVMGCRYAGENPENAKELVTDWDELNDRLAEFKARRKKA